MPSSPALSLDSTPPPAALASKAAGGRARWSISAAILATLVLPVALYYSVQRGAYEELLSLPRMQLAGEEDWLLPAVILSTSAVLLLPGLILASIAQLFGWVRASRRCFVGFSSLALFALLVDLDLLRSIGRHVTELLAVALLPQGREAAGHGGLGTWLRMLVQWSLLAVAGSVGVTHACERLMSAVLSRSTFLVSRTLGCASGFCLAMIAIGPHAMRDGWRNPGLFERTYGTLLLDLRMGTGELDDTQLADPVLRDLYPRLRESYRKAYPTLLAGKPGDPSGVSFATRPPNVVLIVTESLREDVFGEELMPRLSHWAQSGLVAAEHGPGTIYSQAAMFALLYGRSPAVFHQTLDARVPPQFCSSLRASGYECAYFTGHPKVWLRREEYLNEQTMDHFVHDDRGTWPDWDQRALDNMVQMVSKSEKPLFALVFLMSSHFEYQYPAKYEIDRPVANSVWQVTTVSTLGPDDAAPHRNRYRNSVRFIDDVVADAIAKLDPKRNLIIFTGDHGESLYDDGHFSHGYAFSEVVTRTPFAMVGPGVSPSRIESVTSHVDVLPTVLHVLTGQHQSVAHTHGYDWLLEEPRNSFLETYSPDPRDRIKAQLRVDGAFLRFDLDLRAPRITLLGFEDAFGRLLPSPQISALTAHRLAQAFEEHLSLLRR